MVFDYNNVDSSLKRHDFNDSNRRSKSLIPSSSRIRSLSPFVFLLAALQFGHTRVVVAYSASSPSVTSPFLHKSTTERTTQRKRTFLSSSTMDAADTTARDAALERTSKRIIPITVLSGFLGSGKTSLLQHLLTNNEGKRIAVIVNDVASVNIDSKLILQDRSGTLSGGGGDKEASAAGIVQLENGCACCSLADDLLSSVSELVTLSDLQSQGDCCPNTSKSRAFDHIVVELSGVAEPKSIRSNFQEAALYDMPLLERVRLDTMITVLDCETFLSHLRSGKLATPTEAPELYYRTDAERLAAEEMHQNSQEEMAGFPAELMEALNAGSNTYGSDSGVVDLIVEQTEVADILLLNKVDSLRDDDNDPNSSIEDRTLSKIREMAQSLNPSATIIETSFGKVDSLDSILGAFGGKGVVSSGVVDDHKDAVAAAVAAADVSESTSSVVQDAVDVDLSSDPKCNDSGHDHNHQHNHNHHNPSDAHTAAASTSSSEPSCDDPQCTDTTHNHSHNHHAVAGSKHAGIGTFVYSARRPFHPTRLVNLFLRFLPISRSLLISSGEETNIGEEQEVQLKQELNCLFRSKGFLWMADSNVAASFWSHAGSSFEMQCLGRWWATLDRSQWPEEARKDILADFDDENHTEGATNSVGDRRQEVVFIGTGVGNHDKQHYIREALNKCLLTDEEWDLFQTCNGEEQSLRERFPNPVSVRMMNF